MLCSGRLPGGALRFRCAACRRTFSRRVPQVIRAAHPGPERINAAEDARIPHRAPLPEKALDAACQYFGERPPRGVTLKDLAAFFATSPRRLNRLFYRAGCESPMREFRRQRLLGAFKEIQTSPRSIDAIADNFHCSDRSSFVRAFRRAFGFYPTRLRKQRSE